MISPALTTSGFDANVPLILNDTGSLYPYVASFTSRISWLLFIENTIENVVLTSPVFPHFISYLT